VVTELTEAAWIWKIEDHAAVSDLKLMGIRVELI
jgi:hypothetical protein